MKKLVCIMFVICLLFLSGCDSKNTKYFLNHNLMYFNTNYDFLEEIKVSYDDDNSGVITKDNLIFKFSKENGKLFLKYDRICDDLSEYETTMAEAEAAWLESNNNEYDYIYFSYSDYWINDKSIAENISGHILFEDSTFEAHICFESVDVNVQFYNDGTLKIENLPDNVTSFHKYTYIGTYEKNGELISININKSILNDTKESTCDCDTFLYVHDGIVYYEILVPQE